MGAKSRPSAPKTGRNSKQIRRNHRTNAPTNSFWLCSGYFRRCSLASLRWPLAASAGGLIVIILMLYTLRRASSARGAKPAAKWAGTSRNLPWQPASGVGRLAATAPPDAARYPRILSAHASLILRRLMIPSPPMESYQPQIGQFPEVSTDHRPRKRGSGIAEIRKDRHANAPAHPFEPYSRHFRRCPSAKKPAAQGRY